MPYPVPTPPAPKPRHGACRSILNALGATLLLVAAFGMLLGALGYMDQTVPGKSGAGVAITLLSTTAFWLFGGLWMGYRSRWGWAVAFWFALPLAFPLYVYQASRGTAGTSGNRFPIFRSAEAIALLAIALIFITVSVSTNTSDPETAANDESPSVAASPVAIGPAGPRTWFDPEAITRQLLRDPFYSSIQTGCDDYEAERWDESYWDAYANVAQECDFGGIEFIVFETDQEADQTVVELRGAQPASVPGYVQYETAGMVDDDFAAFYVAVGNVVVAASAADEWIVDYGYEDDFASPEDAASALAEEAIERLINLGGAPPGSAGTAM